jgi:hypothetical protein
MLANTFAAVMLSVGSVGKLAEVLRGFPFSRSYGA